MPRRKGHGIPPTKRVKPEAISRSAPLKSKLYNDIPPISVKEEPIQMTVNTVPIKSEPPSIISDALHSKYLHKKFKKMASTLLPEESNNQINNLLNGSRGKRVPEVITSSDSEKVLSPPAGSPKSEVPMSNSRVISPPAGRYVCSYCKLACAKPSVLQKHIRAHTNERPYPCLPCGFAFKTKSNLYKHCRSRAHACKVEESGEKMPIMCDGEEGITSEEDDSSNISTAASVNSRVDTDPESKEEMPKSIYKPKYRFMEQPLKSPNSLEKFDEKKENTGSPPRLHLKIPLPNSAVTASTPSPFTSGSSPSPEFLHRHISKLISENQAIVETNDPFWTKKYLQRSNSNDNNSTPSPLPLSPSSGDINMKKSVRHTGGFESAEEISCDKLATKHSKLALALLRPQSAISPKYSNLPTSDVCDAQPLNLTTNNKDQSVSQQRTQDQNSRKRSHSEDFSDKSPKPLRDRLNAVPLKLNNHAALDYQRSVLNISETTDSMMLNNLDIKKEFTGNPQNPEGSIIKDLLLKARASGSAVNPSVGQALGTSGVDSSSISKPVLSLTPPVSDERAYSPSSQLTCHLCKDPIAYRSEEHLVMHQLYHCKGNDASSTSSHNSPSPHGDPHRLSSPSFRKNKEGPMLITPSHPSPGPLLGSTPLVDSYRTKSPLPSETSLTVLKKRRFETGTMESRVISATTLRSLEELSKCPMRSNLQMFGGEVKILDSPGGEAKTIRIEPTNRGPTKPSDIPLQISSHLGKNVVKEENDQDNNMVVTIAKQGLHSGGSIVQVPPKGGTREQHSPRQTPTSRSVISTPSGPHLQGYQEPNKLIVPIIPKGTTPPVHLPYIPFTSILPESAVINPLTNITAYNPLTLPPANLLPPNSPGVGIPSQYSSGIVTILHGGKEIPYVPGMPGPHSLLPNHHVPVYSSKLESDSKFARVSEAKLNSQQDQFSRSPRNEKSQAALNKPSSLSIPTIQVNSETMDSPGDQSCATNFRKRSLDESQPPASTAPKRSQMSIQFSEADEKDQESIPEKKFLRPTSLPLKPGTFVPKRQQVGTPVLSLVSPETPRPRKSYGQLYLNGHAYTYLGLKCSTRMFFCTLNKPQPIYVPLSPEHNKVSMYSNWKVCSDSDPNPFGLDPGQVMGLYDSRHRPTTYTLARSQTSEAVTHSSYWSARQRSDHQSDKEESSEAVPKRVKIFAGGFESNEDYIYVRGRGRGRYVCEECGIRCKKPSMLKKHIRTHTDVRPFTCIHCKFSFKTKGNLTKHMKSKAHYKKCVDLGITPVPTVVDDSYVDEVALARQQALREKQGGNPEESEEEEEDEDEDDTDDDNDEDEDEGEEGEECVEREAARSLLTLSESLQSVAQRQQVSAGLIPVSGRPFTYPYSYSQVTEPSHLPTTQPQTPTLTAISAQREREKVSQNTGLAREVQAKGSVEELTGNVGEKGVAARYYFPSSRDLGDSDREPAVQKQPTPIDLSSKPTEKSARVCEAAMLLASLCSTMERLPLTTTTAPVSEDSTLLQAYLTERAVQDSRMKQHQYKHKPASMDLPPTTPTKNNISVAKENALGILAQTSSDARRMPVSEAVVTSSSPNKPQAEFFPPSSGPSPSYVSILEDGRSKCNICNKVFSKPSQLRLHVNIHYFERPFRCESCAVSFRTKGHLQKHQRSVSHLNKVSMNSTFGTATTANPRPFKCDDCKIAFRIHGHLAKHLRSKMHIMKLECLGKLPFGTYAEMERSGVNMNDIDTTDCDNSLESLQLLAQKLYEKDPSKLGQWDPNEMMPQHTMSSGDTSSEGEEDPSPHSHPSPLVQRLAPPPLQRATLSGPQEPLKCVINIRNSSVNYNLKGPRHKGPSETSEEGSTDNVDSVSNTRTDDSGQS